MANEPHDKDKQSDLKGGLHSNMPDSASRSTSRESGVGASREGAQSPKDVSEDEIDAMRRASGAIAEVIEPVTRTRKERTNQ